MHYVSPKFSVVMTSPTAAKDLAERWEQTFGKKEPAFMAKPPPVIVPEPPAPVVESPAKTCVPISGVWLRTREEQGETMKWTVIELLVEVDREFRLIQTHRVPCIDGTISHITEPAGIEKAPIDKL